MTAGRGYISAWTEDFWRPLLHGPVPEWLSDREWTVIQGRVGYHLTQRAIAEHLGVSLERVAQIEAHATNKAYEAQKGLVP